MGEANTRWHKTLFWGAMVALLYWALFLHAEDITRLARTTVDACAVAEGDRTDYYSKPTPEACAARGGRLIEGNGLFVLVPILIAFLVSYVHGAFTGMFWDSLGLKAAPKKK
jgi:hypothetical protein